jgi:hypothetical protein
MSVKQTLVYLPLIVALGACGGGGGSDKPKTSSNSSVVQISSSTSSLQQISSSQTSSSSIPSSSANSSSSQIDAQAVTVNVSGNLLVKSESGEIDEAAEDTDINISLSLLDDNQQVLNSADAKVIGGDTGRFGFSHQISASDPKFVVINISKPGYTDFARRFEFKEKIELQAEISELPTAFIEAIEAETISGELVNGFSFSVTGNNLGESNSGYGEELSVFIPQSVLPQGTTSLEVRMKAYDPTDPEEAAYFPGAYEDSDGNKLLSIAFNYADVKTNQGVSLQKVAQQARQERIAAQKSGRLQKDDTAEPVIVNRMIPGNSCRVLATMGDSDSSTAGFQIPVYTYNPYSGLWDLLGQGSVFNQNSELLASDFTDFDCDSVDYMLEVKVDKEIFISKWWNLDYAIVFEQPETFCAKAKLLDEGNSPLVGTYVYASDDDDDRSFSTAGFVSDSEGKVDISLIRLNSMGLDTSITLSAWSPVDGKMLVKNIDLSTEACDVSSPVIPVQLSIPSRCQVKGTLVDKNSNPLPASLIVAIAGNEALNDAEQEDEYAFTDAQGKYSVNLFCDYDYRLADYITWVSNINLQTGEQGTLPLVNVDGTKGADEISDDGKVVQFKDLVSAPKPWAIVDNGGESPELLEIDIYYAGEDFPLTYSFDLIHSQTEEVIKHFEGSVTEDEFIAQGSQSFAKIRIPHTIELSEDELYLSATIAGEIKDSIDLKGSLWGYFFLIQNSVE